MNMEQSNALVQPESLPRLIEQAAAALAQATTAAEILDVGYRANIICTTGKSAARLAAAKGAHDEIVAACHRAMADALIIEAQAQCRLADEYDAAQERGELARHSSGNPKIVSKQGDLQRPATSAEFGITRQQAFEARIIRDAEKTNPGVVRKTVEASLAAGKAPTRADVKRATKPPPPPPPPVDQSQARNTDAGQPVTTDTPALETEDEDALPDSSWVCPIVLAEYIRRKAKGIAAGTIQQEDWITTEKVFQAMCDFVKNTLALIDDRALKATAACDDERLDEYQKLCAAMDVVFPIFQKD